MLASVSSGSSKLLQYSWSHVITIQVKKLKITPHLLPPSPLPITTPCSSKIITLLTSYTVDEVFIFCFGLHGNEIFHCVFCGISFFPGRSFWEPLAISHHLIQSEMEITPSWSLLSGLWISIDGSLLFLGDIPLQSQPQSWVFLSGPHFSMEPEIHCWYAGLWFCPVLLSSSQSPRESGEPLGASSPCQAHFSEFSSSLGPWCYNFLLL